MSVLSLDAEEKTSSTYAQRSMRTARRLRIRGCAAAAELRAAVVEQVVAAVVQEAGRAVVGLEVAVEREGLGVEAAPEGLVVRAVETPIRTVRRTPGGHGRTR